MRWIALACALASGAAHAESQDVRLTRQAYERCVSRFGADHATCRHSAVELENARTMEGSEDRWQRLVEADRACRAVVQLQIGMTAEEVKATCLGGPSRIHRARDAQGMSEEWVYAPYDLATRTLYLFFVDGKLTVVEDER